MEKQDMFKVVYGSKLYGTSTPKSDTDEKVVYLPSINDMLLGKKANIFKERFNAEGERIGDGFTMPDNGVETEYFPVQTFVRDFVAGQTYALEMAFAIYGKPSPGPTYEFIKELVENFSNAEVYSMVGFAMKQTFDYVRRGERLNDAQAVLDVVNKFMPAKAEEPSRNLAELAGSNTMKGAGLKNKPELRLDDVLEDGRTILEHVAEQAGLETEVLLNGKKPQNSLKLNGRNYLESTTVEHLRNQVLKVIQGFGDRSTAAASTEVDYKSLSHAVRVYQQAIELLDTSTITFPRPNAEYLLKVKEGREDLEVVKAQLLALDDEVQAKMLTSTMRKKTPELQKAAEEWLVVQLRGLYNLENV